MSRKDTEFLVQKIRTEYTEKEHTELDELKALDKKVKRPPTVFAYVFGTVGSLVLGTGMSLAMKVIGDMMPLGIAVGALGIAMVCLTYPIYKSFLARRRKRYASEILELSYKLTNSDETV